MSYNQPRYKVQAVHWEVLVVQRLNFTVISLSERREQAS